jgi:ubiquinone/menaquinone biosynthesis C-methylase UbiE
MAYDPDVVREYWERDDVESMYDKHLLASEIALITRRLRPHTRILDAGCGEGESTLVYASLPGVIVHGADFSSTRLSKAEARLGHLANVSLRKVDFLQDPLALDEDYDFVISQRFLINVTDWELQKRVLGKLIGLTRPGGRLIMLEGSVPGTEELDAFRALWGLPPIAVRWHNLFLDDAALIAFMESAGCRFVEADGLGSYFVLTRGLRPVFDQDLAWDSEFNRISAGADLEHLLDMKTRFSRLRLFTFEVNR